MSARRSLHTAVTAALWLSSATNWVVPGAAIAATLDSGEEKCGSLDNAFGPYDYTNREDRQKRLKIVEDYHFTVEVETLVKGKAGPIPQDLDYTLRAFPNHHRALRAMARLQLKTPRPENAEYRSADCYFDRAKRFRPRDVEVYMIHGWYLHQRGDHEVALAQYREAEKLRPGASAPRDLRIGLLLFDMKRYDEARQYAERAYAQKHPDTELREKLKSVNYWRQ